MIKRHLNKRNTKEVSLYLTTGILGSVVDLLCFSLSLWLGAPTILSQWIGASLGAIHNSLIHHYFVFNHSKKLKHTVLPNTLLSILTIAVSGPALLAIDQIAKNLWLSKIIVLALTAILSYLIRKLVIFNK